MRVLALHGNRCAPRSRREGGSRAGSPIPGCPLVVVVINHAASPAPPSPVLLRVRSSRPLPTPPPLRAFLKSQTGEIFETRLASHVAALRRAVPDAVVTFADAPVDLPLRAGDDLPLKTWWREDDSDGDDDGWDAILATLRAYWRSSGPFVGVVGFSQGASVAALLAALSADAESSEASFASSLEWVVLCAGRVPAREMARLLAGKKIKIRAGSGSTRREEEPGSNLVPNLVPRVRSARALVIAGDADEAVPPVASLECADWFEDAEVWTHAGGHHFPASRRDVDAFVGFIVEGGDATREASGSEDGNEGFEKSNLHPVRHAVEHPPSGPATTEALRDEIEALEAIFGDELETTAPGREFRFAIPSARASLRVALPAAYPTEPPEIVDVRVERADDDSRDDSSKRSSTSGVSTRGPSPRAPKLRRILEGVREAARRAAAEVYPGEPAVYAVVTACREWLEENLVLPSRKSDDDVGDDEFFRASEENNAPKTRPKTPEGADPADPGSSVPGGQGGGLDRWWESESPPDLASVAAASAEAAAYEAERCTQTHTNISLANAKGGGPWTFRVGLVGKPSAGKSTFFNAVVQSRGVNNLAGISDSANDAPPPPPARLALTSPRPFTTIAPNLASTLAPVACPCAKFGLETLCAPRTGAEEVRGEHHRLVPVHVKDVAGLVPGAHAGRGRGNAFLNDLCDADVLAHVVDCSGQTDEDGNDVGAARDDSSNRRRYSPADDVAWVREELHLWIFSNVRRKWRAVRRDPSALRELFTGYHCVAAVADEAMRRAGFFEPKPAQNQKKNPADEPIGRERESPNLHSESSLRKRTDTTHRAPRESETRVHKSGARIVSRETILGLAERDLHRLVAHFLRVRFPTVLVLNKMDAAGARAHADAIKRRFPREPTAETVATTREGTRAALRDAVRLKPPALAFPTDELPATVSTGGVDAGGGGFDDGSKSEENGSKSAAAGSNNTSAAGSNNKSAAGSHTSAAGSKSDGAMRDCLVMKPGSTVWDAFEAWRRSSSSHAAGCDSDSSGAGSGSRRGEFVRAECLDGTRGGARRIARRGEALGDANGVLKFYVNRKARWQGKKVGLTKK